MRAPDGRDLSTALEIKTGKHHSVSYRGQVMIYSLLISERFKNANPDNILLYIMDNPVKDGFEYLKQQKLELDSLVLGRNEIAKWQKLNSAHIDIRRALYSTDKNNPAAFDDDLEPDNDSQKADEIEDSAKKWDNIKVVKLPPMISRVSECKGCFSKEVCSLAAISLEADKPLKAPTGQFQAF